MTEQNLRKMTFIFEDEDLKITHEIINETWLPHVLDSFKNFLTGCSYVINGEIEVVKDEVEDEI